MNQDKNFQEIEKIINDSIKEATKNLAKGFALYNKSILENLQKINPFITTGIIEFFDEKLRSWEKDNI